MTHAQPRSWVREWRPAFEAIPPVERTDTDGVRRETRKFRGVTPEQAVEYLAHLGGERRGENVVEGDGWRATLSSAVVPVGPSYRLTEVTVTWTGDPERVEWVVPQFQLKVFRAPG